MRSQWLYLLWEPVENTILHFIEIEESVENEQIIRNKWRQEDHPHRQNYNKPVENERQILEIRLDIRHIVEEHTHQAHEEIAHAATAQKVVEVVAELLFSEHKNGCDIEEGAD